MKGYQNNYISSIDKYYETEAINSIPKCSDMHINLQADTE